MLPAKKEIDDVIMSAGEEALAALQIPDMPSELVRLIGNMKFHTVYGQNLLQHSREVAMLSGLMAAELKRGLRARGIEVIDIGIADTPQNYFAIGHLGASGGIQVTASHNPSVYNGFKIGEKWELFLDLRMKNYSMLVTVTEASLLTTEVTAGFVKTF